MSWLEVVTVVTVAAWLAVLTIALMLCIRQLAIHRVRLEQMMRGGAGSGAGPAIGFSVSPALGETYPELRRSRMLVVVLSGNCVNCLQVIEEWERGDGPAEIDSEEVLLLITGQDGAPSEDAARRVSAFGSVVREPNASHLAKALSITYRPSALLLEEGLITGTAVLEHASDMNDLLAPRAGGANREDPVAGATD